MKTKKYLYHTIYDFNNIILAWRKARKGKTKRDYVVEFEENFEENLRQLRLELMSLSYKPKPLETFILRDPKTRKISRAEFKDRIVHHALCNIIAPLMEKSFIYDSHANQIGKGNLKAIERFDKFRRKVSKNNTRKSFVLKADIKHYFQEVNHKILLDILEKKLKDENLINLIKKILINGQVSEGVGMPLGNLTSQFLANVYLNELDYFVKHKLKARYYIRYVDDFIILHKDKNQLKTWKKEINNFLQKNLDIELHKDKSRIISLSRGTDFVGFRNFYHYKLLRKRNCRSICAKIEKHKQGNIPFEQLLESFQGWNAYAKWGNTYKFRKRIFREINQLINNNVETKFNS
jgi:RNA-directed DNA polymerase